MKPTAQSVIADILTYGTLTREPRSMGEISGAIVNAVNRDHHAYTLVLALKMLVATGELKASGSMCDAYAVLYAKP